jgi:hypothetical protein
MAKAVALLPELGTVTRAERLAEALPEAPRCSRPGCFRPPYAGSLCKLHGDLAWYRQGCPPLPPPD